MALRILYDAQYLRGARSLYRPRRALSGGGKSTIVRLLLGFETPEAGTICYDDQDVSRLDVYAVRRQIGVVLQQSRIMASSIFENIASGAVITMDEAWEAARAAGLM